MKLRISGIDTHLTERAFIMSITRPNPAAAAVRFIAIFSLLFLHACSQDPSNPVGHGLDAGLVIEAATGEIGPEGGSVFLSDGATVSIPAGVLTSSMRVQWAKLKHDTYFTGATLFVYDIRSDGPLSHITMEIPVDAGQARDDFSVYNYDPDFDADIDGQDVSFSYDSLAGRISADIQFDGIRSSGSVRKSLAGIKRTRVVVANEALVDPSVTRRIIPMPYYQQDALTCYATCVKMLERAYAPEGDTKISQILKWIDYPPTTGPNAYMYKYHMPRLIKLATNLTALTGQYWWARSAFNNLIKQLDAGYPVVIGRANHSFMIIGYEKTTGLRGPSSYRYLIHDSDGDFPPNTWKDWNWVFKRTYDTGSFVEVWIPKPPPDSRALQTIGMPMTGATGFIQILQTMQDTGDDIPLVTLGFNKDMKEGYGWKSGSRWLRTIPEEATKLYIQAPLRNADQSKNPQIGVNLRVTQHGSGGGSYYKTDFLTPPSSGEPIDYEKTVAIDDFFRPGGDTSCTMIVELLNQYGAVIDKYSVEFVLAPATAEYRIIRESGNADPSGIKLTLPTEVEFGKSYHIRGVWGDVPTYPDAQYSVLGGFVADESDLEKEFWVQAIFRDKFLDLKGFRHYFDSNITIPDTDRSRKYFKLQITMRAYNAANASAPYWLQTRIYKIPIKR
jgi:hypothetical protein